MTFSITALSDLKNSEDLKNEFSSFWRRWQLQDVVREVVSDKRWLTDKARISVNMGHMPERVCGCLRVPTMVHNDVSVVRNEKGFANYRGLQTCGSVWACPLCSSKISEFRADELRELSKRFYDRFFSGTVLMITFTIPHKINNNLSVLVDQLGKCRRELKRQKLLKRDKTFVPFSQILHDYGYIGDVYSLEVTYGYNGWHPHTHDLFFFSSKITVDKLQDLKSNITMSWLKSCLKSGVVINNQDDFLNRSVDLKIANSPESYISKWGLQDFESHSAMIHKSWGPIHELTKSNQKVSRSEHYSPWSMLEIIRLNYDRRDVFFYFGKLFYEFLQVFKGKRQLVFSKGFKKFFLISEKSDEEIVKDVDHKFQFLGALSRDEWKRVLKHKKRADILIMSSLESWEIVKNYVGALSL